MAAFGICGIISPGRLPWLLATQALEMASLSALRLPPLGLTPTWNRVIGLTAALAGAIAGNTPKDHAHPNLESLVLITQALIDTDLARRLLYDAIETRLHAGDSSPRVILHAAKP